MTIIHNNVSVVNVWYYWYQIFAFSHMHQTSVDKYLLSLSYLCKWRAKVAV